MLAFATWRTGRNLGPCGAVLGRVCEGICLWTAAADIAHDFPARHPKLRLRKRQLGEPEIREGGLCIRRLTVPAWLAACRRLERFHSAYAVHRGDACTTWNAL